MRVFPRCAALPRKLAALPVLTTLFLACASPAAAGQSPDAEAVRLLGEGRAVAARDHLVQALASPAAAAPDTRLRLLEGLLDVCLQSHDMACVAAHFPAYGEIGGQVAASLSVPLRRQLVRRTLVYLDHQRLASGRPDQLQAILERPEWQAEFPGDAPLYLRRQLVLSNALLQSGDFAGATRSVDRILSLIAALENPQDGAYWPARALVDVIGTLMHMGDSERAWGVYLASRPLILQGTPALGVDAVELRLTEARLLQERGELSAAREALASAVDILGRIELGADVRDWLAGEVLTLQAVVCTALSDPACAQSALAAHPMARTFETARPAAHYGEITYLAARALVASAQNRADPAAAAALAAPVAFETPGVPRNYVEIYRQAGLAILLPEGPARTAAVREMARTLSGYAHSQRQNAFGAGYRPGVVDQILILLGLSQVDAGMTGADREAAFALFQLVGRIGPSFDADAQTRLGQARDRAERRSIHQALRLRARRDRLERQELAAVAARASVSPPSGSVLRYDLARRARFREFANDLLRAQPVLAPAASLVSLADLQAALRPGEAAIAFAPAGGGQSAHMCVRRDRVVQARQPIDAQRLQLDIRLLQAALTAGHAPSEALDAQFPVAAAVRLRQALIGPVADCLRPGDHLIWLPAPAMVPLPISVLLDAPPPQAGQGWDLSQADWLVRRHAITYAVSASAFVASRRSGRGADGSFAFLGVGDPQLDGRTAQGADRTQIVLRGARGASGLAALAPLPETRAELQQAAAGFADARLLVGEAATEQAFRRELVGAYRMISFATHGLIRDEIEGLAEPALVFTPVSASDPLDDGLLTASEIADLSLTAGFVALSACNTADYDLTQFAGDLPALASAFAVAGVPSTLATLWPVDSQTSKTIVAGAFGRLGAAPDIPPSAALAVAQRDFLAAPPSRAHLHPRFWAPFIVLGDGGVQSRRTDAPPVDLAAAELITTGGGEVLSVRRTGQGAAARFIAEPRDERFSSAIRLADAGGETWRTDDDAIGAARLVVSQGPVLVAGGYDPDANGRLAAVLEAFDARTGARTAVWREDRQAADTTIAATLPMGERGLFAVVDADLHGRTSADREPSVRVYEVDAALAPRLLFEMSAPGVDGYPQVTLAHLGGSLLITLTGGTEGGAGATATLDDFDSPLCLPRPLTRAELRDLKTGERLAYAELPGALVASATGRGDRFVVGGSVVSHCDAGRRAMVATLDRSLTLAPWWTDAGFGDSEVRSLALAPDGTLVIGAQEILRLDHRPAGSGDFGSVQRTLRRTDFRAQALVRLSEGPGRVSEPLVLSAGSHVFVSDLDASRADEILLGGGVGGEAAILRLRRTRSGR